MRRIQNFQVFRYVDPKLRYLKGPILILLNNLFSSTGWKVNPLVQLLTWLGVVGSKAGNLDLKWESPTSELKLQIIHLSKLQTITWITGQFFSGHMFVINLANSIFCTWVLYTYFDGKIQIWKPIDKQSCLLSSLNIPYKRAAPFILFFSFFPSCSHFFM